MSYRQDFIDAGFGNIMAWLQSDAPFDSPINGSTTNPGFVDYGQAPSVTFPADGGQPTYTPGDYEVPGFAEANNAVPAAPPPPTVVGTYTKRILGGYVVTMERLSNGTEREIHRERSRSAGDAVDLMFQNLGLGQEMIDSVKNAIDNVYNTNLDPSEAQIMNAIYASEAYKKRFAGNEMIRKRLAEGKGRPGDRMLTPAEYIQQESEYRTILQDADMPVGYYDTPDDFNTLIGNSISVAEFKNRVDGAYDALNYADDYVKEQLSSYYGLTTGDLVAYLLDPSKAEPILNQRSLRSKYGLNSYTELNRMQTTAEVGAVSDRVGGKSIGRDFAEEFVDQKKEDLAERAFETATAYEGDVTRLGKLYGETQDMNYQGVAREAASLQGGASIGRKRRKLASKERAAFSQSSGVGKGAFGRRGDV
jgi:hypothetical protein